MDELPMFPLSTVLLPHEGLPLRVFEPRYRTMVARCMSSDRRFGVVLIERGSEVGGGDVRYGTGTVAEIEAVEPTPDGRFTVLAVGSSRFSVHTWLDDDPFPRALVDERPEILHDAAGRAIGACSARVRQIRALWSELGNGPSVSEGAFDDLDSDDIVWRLCSMTPLGPLDRQRLLETDDVLRRIELLSALLDDLENDFRALLKEQG